MSNRGGTAALTRITETPKSFTKSCSVGPAETSDNTAAEMPHSQDLTYPSQETPTQHSISLVCPQTWEDVRAAANEALIACDHLFEVGTFKRKLVSIYPNLYLIRTRAEQLYNAGARISIDGTGHTYVSYSRSTSNEMLRIPNELVWSVCSKVREKLPWIRETDEKLRGGPIRGARSSDAAALSTLLSMVERLPLEADMIKHLRELNARTLPPSYDEATASDNVSNHEDQSLDDS